MPVIPLTFTQCFFITLPFCFAFFYAMFKFIEAWEVEDRVRGWDAVMLVKGRSVIRHEDGTPLMWLEDYHMPCRPVGRGK